MGRKMTLLPTNQLAGLDLGMFAPLRPSGLRLAISNMSLVLFVWLVCDVALAILLAAWQPALPASAPPEPSLGALLQRHRQALGRLPATSAHWTGSITEEGSSARYEAVADRLGRFKRVITLPLSTQADGDDGRVAWSADQNGNVETRPRGQQIPMEARLIRLNDVLLARDLNAALEGTEVVDGKTAYVIRLSAPSRPVKIYLDADSNLVDGADYGSRSVRYRAYRRFGRVPVPTLVEETDGSKVIATTVDDVSFGAQPASAFAVPAQREPDFPSGRTEVLASFDSLRGLIVLRCSANEKPVRMLLDSGSSTSVIDLDAARRLGLPTSGIARVQGAGVLTGTAARIDRFDLAGLIFHPLIVQAVPLQLPGAISRSGVDGVLGYDIFATIVARIAYSRQELRLTAPTAFSYNGTGSVIPLETDQRIARIKATLGSNDTGTFTVDTGSDASLVLFKEFADAVYRDFTDPLELDQQGASGAGGQFVTRVGYVTSLGLGSFSLLNVRTEVVLRPTGAFSPTISDGLIGAGSLSTFRAVFLDYPGRRFILER